MEICMEQRLDNKNDALADDCLKYISQVKAVVALLSVQDIQDNFCPEVVENSLWLVRERLDELENIILHCKGGGL